MKAVKIALLTAFSLVGLASILLFVAVLALWLRPQGVVYVSNSVLETLATPYTWEAREIELTFNPVNLRAEGVNVVSSAEVGSDLSISKLDLTIELFAWIAERPFWSLMVGEIEMLPHDVPSHDQAISENSKTPEAQSNPDFSIDIPAELLSFQQIVIDRLKLGGSSEIQMNLERQGKSVNVRVDVIGGIDSSSTQIAGEGRVTAEGNDGPTDQNVIATTGTSQPEIQLSVVGALDPIKNGAMFALHLRGHQATTQLIANLFGRAELDDQEIQIRLNDAQNSQLQSLRSLVDKSVAGEPQASTKIADSKLIDVFSSIEIVLTPQAETSAETTLPSMPEVGHKLLPGSVDLAYNLDDDNLSNFELRGEYHYQGERYPLVLEAEVNSLLGIAQLMGSEGNAGVDVEVEIEIQGKFGESNFEFDVQGADLPAADLARVGSDAKNSAENALQNPLENNVSWTGNISLHSEGLPKFIDSNPFTSSQLLPANLGGHFAYAQNRLQLTDWKVDSPSQKFDLALLADLSSALTLDAQLIAEKISIPIAMAASSDVQDADAKTDEPVLTAAKQPQANASAPTEIASDEAEQQSRLFSDQPFALAWLADANVQVTSEIDALHLQDAVFTDVNIAVNAKQGSMQIKPMQGHFGDGGFIGDLNLQIKDRDTDSNADRDMVDLSVAFDLTGIDLEAFGILPRDELTGGDVESHIQLTGIGASTAELVASLQGDIVLLVEGATLANDIVELAGSDVLLQMVNKLNPFHKEDPSTELSCALVHFDIDSGVMKSERELVMETDKMKIVGSGKINLAEENLDITFSPSAKQGVGVNVGSLVKFMKLGGRLTAPAPQVDALGVLQSGAAIGAALSTGGVSVLAEGLAKRALNAGSACERFRKNTLQLVPQMEQDSVDTPATTPSKNSADTATDNTVNSSSVE